MRAPLCLYSAGLVALLAAPVLAQDPAQASQVVLSWNDLGMHCVDPDFSIFALLPPFNTLNSHVIIGGKLQKTASARVTYQAMADPTGSINTTSIGKTNFWKHVKSLFGVQPPPDVGLTGSKMPGKANTPQPTKFDTQWKWFQAQGIPLTPIDDAMRLNPYPLMKVIARDSSGREIANTVTSVPTSNELACRKCHDSAGNPFARPAAGWLFDPDPVRDNRLNILRLHDERQINKQSFKAALAKLGYNKAGLLATVKTDGKAVLCANCHVSNALPGTGIAGIPAMTDAIHTAHSRVLDTSGKLLDANPTRSACYNCHPGFKTQCLRGAMGKAIGTNGKFAIQCQSCHGSMSAVGDFRRTGWLDEPTCQNCHSGTATQNTGKIRYTSVFDANGKRRKPANNVYATTPDVPKKGFSLYRFSSGHGGLQCAACHGPPHAIYPTSTENDNLQSKKLQGHIGTISDCTVCHGKLQKSQMLRGPHGMHPVDSKWAGDKHGDLAKGSRLATCQACHGRDNKGTVLSMAKGDRVYRTKFGTKRFWRGFRVGCYNCHRGPKSEHRNSNRAPVVPSLSARTPNDVPTSVTLRGTDADNNRLTFRVVDQPKHGTVAFNPATNGTKATYLPKKGYTGTDVFTYAAYDGQSESNLGTVTMTVTAASCRGSLEAYGFGCPGTGPFLPVLSASGCATPGQTITLDLANGRGGALGVVLFGVGRTAHELAGGCVLRVTPPLVASKGLIQQGSGAGRGKFTLPIKIPGYIPRGVRLTMQAFLVDPGSQVGWSNSNGIDMTIR